MVQPGLGKVADVYGYPTSYPASAVIQAGALPFLIRPRHKKAVSDPIDHS